MTNHIKASCHSVVCRPITFGQLFPRAAFTWSFTLRSVIKKCRHAVYRWFERDVKGLKVVVQQVVQWWRYLAQLCDCSSLSKSLLLSATRIATQAWVLKLNKSFTTWAIIQHCNEHSWHTSIYIRTGSLWGISVRKFSEFRFYTV